MSVVPLPLPPLALSQQCENNFTTPPSTFLVPNSGSYPPIPTSKMWKSLIKIVDDAIYAEGVPITDLTPRELHTREAMFAITVVAPLTGALLALFFAPASHRPKYSLYFCPDTEAEMRHLHVHKVDAEREKLRNLVRYYKLVACWFTSIAIFGTVIYLQAGRTTRFTFILAVFHKWAPTKQCDFLR